MMRFGSVCSGIEAASVAWHPLGWQAAWLAEIEPFPSAVLKHHYPDVPNLGDMTTLPDRIRSGEVEAPDLFCGGTPCQAFSVAGLRKSLDDARGNLSLTFCEIANAIDHVRSAGGKPASIVFWENVPGVLSTKDNAFGCFLAGLAGEDGELQPPGGKWQNAGCVFGPERAVAWRVLDAQYFGVAQRRRRVFVVASARDGFDPAAVLFEFDGLRRDTAPSREAGKVAPTIPSRSTAGGGLGTDFDCDGGVIASDVCPTLRAGGNSTGGDRPPGTDVDTADSLVVMSSGQANAEIRTDGGAPALTCLHEAPIAAYAIQAGALRTNPDSGPDGVGIQAEHAYTLEARAEVQCVAQVVGALACNTGPKGHDAGNFACNQAVDAGHVLPVTTHTLRGEGFDASEDGTGRGTPLVPVGIFQDSEFGVAQYDSAGTLRAGRIPEHQMVMQPVTQPYTLAIRGRGDTHQLEYRQDGTANALLTPNGGRGGIGVGAIAAPVAIRPDATPKWQDDLAFTLTQPSPTGGGQPQAIAFHPTQDPISSTDVCHSIGANENATAAVAVGTDCFNGDITGDVAATMGTRGSSQNASGPTVMQSMQVRRLTPVECERLQGFPDNYTAIPWRKKPASECPDGPRYKALGNSWAVPVVRWIGRRIAVSINSGCLSS